MTTVSSHCFEVVGFLPSSVFVATSDFWWHISTEVKVTEKLVNLPLCYLWRVVCFSVCPVPQFQVSSSRGKQFSWLSLLKKLYPWNKSWKCLILEQWISSRMMTKTKTKNNLVQVVMLKKIKCQSKKNDLYYKTAFHFMCKIYMVLLEHVPRFYCESPVCLFSSLGEDEKYWYQFVTYETRKPAALIITNVFRIFSHKLARCRDTISEYCSVISFGC